MPRSKRTVIGFWIVTALFCLQIGFTAYAQLRLPQVAEAFTHLGFPDYFRVELSLAKLLGVVLLLAPVTARLKEWAYAGMVFDVTGAAASHASAGDPPSAVATPLVILLLVVGSWLLRPANRRLAGTDVLSAWRGEARDGS